MNTIGELLRQPRLFESKRKPRERDFPINEMYAMYASEQERKLRKMYNFNNYKAWLQLHRYKHSLNHVSLFKKDRRFVGELEIGAFCIRLAKLSPDDLYYMNSIVKDKYHRGESVGAYIRFNFLGSLKPVASVRTKC